MDEVRYFRGISELKTGKGKEKNKKRKKKTGKGMTVVERFILVNIVDFLIKK